MPDSAHIAVMPNEVMRLLDLKAGQTVVDATLGMAGHASLMAEVIGPTGHLIGLDKDSASLAKAKARLAHFKLRIDVLRGSFSSIDTLLAEVNVSAVDGILMDLGISSFQLDDSSRGFAFSIDGPLDMRMDTTQGKNAADLVNSLSQSELERIFWEWGEERFSRQFAAAIIKQRAATPITTTKQLADLMLRALPASYQRGRIHPATRSFQALRIAVNGELEALKQGIVKAWGVLKPGGRLVIISFHSLEDRIVKQTFKAWQHEGLGEVLVKKPLEATDEECAHNSRSRSAKVRGIVKLG